MLNLPFAPIYIAAGLTRIVATWKDVELLYDSHTDVMWRVISTVPVLGQQWRVGNSVQYLGQNVSS